jgi:hypothetical protein
VRREEAFEEAHERVALGVDLLVGLEKHPDAGDDEEAPNT